MGQVECKPPEVRCKGKRQAEEADADNDIAAVTDDPETLLAVIQGDWKMVPAERTGPPMAPPDPSAPPSTDPNALKAMIPQTFAEMAGFNAFILLGPAAPELKMLPILFEAMPVLVDAVGSTGKLSKEGMTFGSKLKEAGVTSNDLGKFKGVMIASLRSLLPRTWGAQSEVAWLWFWTRVTKALDGPMGSHVALVQSSWASIKTVSEPPPEGQMAIPQTFQEMFMFNLMVMTTAESPGMTWVGEMIPCMGALVQHIGEEAALNKECEAAGSALKGKATVQAMREFEAIAYATLRALLPHVWDTAHESAWTWFWSVISRKLCAHLA